MSESSSHSLNAISKPSILSRLKPPWAIKRSALSAIAPVKKSDQIPVKLCYKTKQRSIYKSMRTVFIITIAPAVWNDYRAVGKI